MLFTGTWKLLQDNEIQPMSDGGQVVAGSNPVSPTSIIAGQIMFLGAVEGASAPPVP
jgi:hypothetical protein